MAEHFPYSSFTLRLADGTRQHGERWDPTELTSARSLIAAFNTGARVEIDVYGDGQVIERGRVSTTTGWRPSFLLMHRISDHSSSTLLDSRSRILRVIAK